MATPQPTHWSDTESGKKLIKTEFITAGLPEVEEKDLEAGTYTNMQIAKKIDNPFILLRILENLPQGCDSATRRAIISFIVDGIPS